MFGESTYFKIHGRSLPTKSARNVRGSRRFIEQAGQNVRLADGTRETLRRPQFLKKDSVTISGNGVMAPPIQDLKFGDIITIDFPHPYSLSGEVALEDLDFPPSPDRLWYYDGKSKMLPAGDPNIEQTIWIPQMTIMIDAVTTDYDDGRAQIEWSIEGEVI